MENMHTDVRVERVNLFSYTAERRESNEWDLCLEEIGHRLLFTHQYDKKNKVQSWKT